jgi:hypothetical protein
MSDWFCAYTGVNAELIAFHGLRQKQLEAYLPLAQKIISHARRHKIKMVPLLSRYIFLQFEPDRYSDVLAVDGIEMVLSNNLKPIAIPCSVIDEIKEREVAGEFNDKIPETRKRWGKSFEVLKSFLGPQLTNA